MPLTTDAKFSLDTTAQVAWSPVKLGDLLGISIQNGLYKPSSAYGSGVPIVRINDFNNEGQFARAEFQRLAISVEEQNRYGLAPGDILINRVNSLSHIGKSVLVRDLSEPTIFESNMMRLRLNRETLMPEFFAYLLHTPAVRDFFRTRAKKAVAQASINQEDIKAVEFLLPPLPEQRKIAQILGTWDAAINLTEQLIAAKQRRKQGLMQRLLTGQVRFAEFAGQAWKDLPLVEFVSRNSAKYDPQKYTDDLLCIELEHIAQGTGQILEAISVKGQQSVKNRFCAGQVLFGKLRPYLCKYAQPQFDGVCSSEIWVLNGKANVCTNDYLFYLVQTNDFIALANATSGTKMPRADWEHLSQQSFMLPPLDEQAKIVSVFRTCDEELVLHQQKLATLRRQKQGLMQRLLTGAVRVNVDS